MKINSRLRSTILFLLLPVVVLGQADSLSFWESTSVPDRQRITWLGIGGGALMTGGFLALNQLWYTDYPRENFHTFNDNANWLQMDKVGHSVSAYYLGYAGSEAFQWAGVSQRNSILIGGGVSLFFLSGIEVLDGFSSEWGFSTGDMVANLSGSALLVGQELLWKEQHLVLKYSYNPSRYVLQRPDLLGNNSVESIFKDYNAQTYWLSANVHGLTNWEFWPEWLNLAVGYSGDGMITAEYERGLYKNRPDLTYQRQFYISPDIDLRKLDVESKLLKSVLQVLNFIKFPLPALEINQKENARFYPVYF